jgi:hypothetical protein
VLGAHHLERDVLLIVWQAGPVAVERQVNSACAAAADLIVQDVTIAQDGLRIDGCNGCCRAGSRRLVDCRLD